LTRNPPWTFPGGKIEPGESPEAAAARETLEEIGLRVRVTGVIGSRVHPQTGVAIVYMAAKPICGTDVPAARSSELTEVQWVSLKRVDHLICEIFRNVHEYMREVAKPPKRTSGSNGN
jgi:8-oxo-dGTP diphosphatase